jgi:hypothetical protein
MDLTIGNTMSVHWRQHHRNTCGRGHRLETRGFDQWDLIGTLVYGADGIHSLQ